MSKRIELQGTIIQVRYLEDCIRSTRKYSEDLFTAGKKHPLPTRYAKNIPSRVMCKHYEVFPNVDFETVSVWDMDVKDLMKWMRGTKCIHIRFFYDYRENKACVRVKDQQSLDELKRMADPIAESFNTLILGIEHANNVTVGVSDALI